MIRNLLGNLGHRQLSLDYGSLAAISELTNPAGHPPSINRFASSPAIGTITCYQVRGSGFNELQKLLVGMGS